MNSPSHEIALHLASVGVGTFGGSSPWSIYFASEPASPDDTITVYDTPGGEPDTDELDLFRPAFQIRVRSANYAEAYAKHSTIREILTLPDTITAETSIFIGIEMSTDVAGIGTDDNDRHLLVANYRAMRMKKES